MEPKYIVVIICACAFVATLVAFIVVYFLNKKKLEQREREFIAMYSDKNLLKMDYDCAVYDEETERLIARQAEHGQMTIDEVIKAGATDKSVFGTVDTEGLEEITGNYKPAE